MASTCARQGASSNAFAWNRLQPEAVGQRRCRVHNLRVCRCGLTLIELLVVIAILTVLMGLLLPAVQRVREAANQTSCRNNLKQIGVALHSYHTTKGALPPGYFCDLANPMEPDYCRPGWGWAAHILPYLEQSALTAQIQWDQAVEDLVNAEPRAQVVKTYICPSDRDTGVFTVRSQWNFSMGSAATNSYAASYGFGGSIGEAPDSGNGVFYRNSRTRMADIRDGTSTTLAVGERAAIFAQAPWAGVFTAGTIRTNPNSSNCEFGIEEAPVMVLAGTWVDAMNNPYSTIYKFYSAHADMAPFLFADGSVRRLKFDLSWQVWRAIATRHGGETVSEGDY